MKTMFKRRSVTLALGVSLAVLVGCGHGNRIDNKEKQIRIGVILPLTGEASSYGVDCQRGIELAASQSDSNIQFFFEDSKADPKMAINAIQRLISQRQVAAIIGDMFSNTTLAIAPIAQQNGVVLITPTSAATEIPNTGDKIFTIYPSSSFEGEFMAMRAIERGVKSFGILVQQVQAAEEIAVAFNNEMMKNGVRSAYIQRFPEGTRDFRSILANMDAHPINAIFVSAYGQEACTFLRQAKEQGLKTLILSQSTLYDQKLLKEYGSVLEGVLFSAPYYVDDVETPAITEFRTAYDKRFRSAPSVWAAYGYDSAMLILSAISSSKKNVQPLNDSILRMSMSGPTGPLTFRENRTALRSMRLYSVENGKFKAVTQ